MWTDPNLVWDKNAYGGIDQLVVYRDEIWIPDIRSYARLKTELAVEKEMARAIIHSDGSVWISEPALITVKCTLTEASFPFDSIVCTQFYRSNMYAAAQMSVFTTNLPNPLATYRNHSEYDMVS